MSRILVVDDDSVDREQARRCLEPLGVAEILYAADGHEALEAIAREPPDLVVSDLRMPGMDGIELVERIRDGFPLVPVVVMTSMGSERIAARALEAGAASYVPKADLAGTLAQTALQLLALSETRRSRGQVLRYLVSTQTRFDLPNDPRLVSPAVGFLQENMARVGFGSEGVRIQVAVAVTEGVTNAMLHGNLEAGSSLRREDRAAYDRLVAQRQGQEPFRDRRVRVLAHESPTLVRYVIVDEGPGFDRSTLLDPTVPENISVVTGRGLFLIRSFMDRVEHNEKGNEITLTKIASPERPSG